MWNINSPEKLNLSPIQTSGGLHAYKSHVVVRKRNPPVNFIIAFKCKMNNEDSSVVLKCLKVICPFKIFIKAGCLTWKSEFKPIPHNLGCNFTRSRAH